MTRIEYKCFATTSLLLATLIIVVAVAGSEAAVERYKNEAGFLARLAELGYDPLVEGFESSDWDSVRTTGINDINSLPSVTSQRLTWEAAGLDLWSYPTSKTHGITTNLNWAHSGQWGIFEDHVGDPIPTTIRVRAPEPIYGIGGWFDTNPDLNDVGFLFELASTAQDPGYVLPGIGAMYPGDNAGVGHNFNGLIFTDGFTDVVLTGVLEVNEENQLEGGTIFGADDFTFVVPPDFVPNALLGDMDCDDDVDFDDIDDLVLGLNMPLEYENLFGVPPQLKGDTDGDGDLDFDDIDDFVEILNHPAFIDGQSVPEPSTVALIGVAMSALVLWEWQRRVASRLKDPSVF